MVNCSPKTSFSADSRGAVPWRSRLPGLLGTLRFDAAASYGYSIRKRTSWMVLSQPMEDQAVRQLPVLLPPPSLVAG